MPCLDEAETLEICILKAQTWLEKSGVDGEVLIADNGSTDGSQEIATGLGARVINVSRKGYGAALYAGAIESNGLYIVMGDSDDSYDFSNLNPFLDELRNGKDLVMGNRFKGGIERGAMPLKNRYLGNPALSFLGRLMFKIPVRDFHCGLRGFSKSAFLKMDLRTTGMEFASEMVIKASLLGLLITEVPTTLSRDGRTRKPHLKPWRDGWRHLRFMLSLSPKWTFFYPGLLISLIGLSLYVPLLIGDISVGGIVLDNNARILSSTLITLGYTLITWGIALRIFATREGLLPTTKLIEQILSKSVFEVGSLVGILFIFSGFFGVLKSLEFWSLLGFSGIEPYALANIINTSSLLILIGGITLTSSLLFGFLSLPIRKD
jgi:glycosyltransferase involved in cell wall biosynthesis